MAEFYKITINLTIKRCDINAHQTQQNVFHTALGHMRNGDHNAAAVICQQALNDFPNDAHLLCLAAQSCIALKRFDDAKAYAEKAKFIHPDYAVGHEVSADLMLLEGRFEEAIESYEKALSLAPKHPHLTKKIVRAHELIASTSAGNGTNNDLFAKEMSQARQYETDDEPEKAEKIYREILSQDPNQVEAIRLLAAHAAKHHQHKDAEVFLNQAISVDPSYSRAWLDLSSTQLELGKFQEAINSATKSVNLLPNIAKPYIYLANAQAKNNQPELAITTYKKALETTPSHEGAYAGLSHQLKTIGRQEEAIAAHRENIQLNPSNTDSYWNLANMKTFRFDTREVATMQNLLQDENLASLGKSQLANALGLEHESRKDYQAAFNYFQHCNEAQRQQEVYDPVANEVNMDTLISIFNPDFIEKHAAAGISDASPIFIVGLPRSGSTLLEQILASHSQVEGTHELGELDIIAKTFTRNNIKHQRYPETLSNLPSNVWTKIGEEYIERTQKYRSNKVFFIDKNPNNFTHIGLLQLALPNAKIINAKRHPLDSCFGSYKQLFAKGQPFTYDLTEIGEYYLGYQKLMDHWHKVFPNKVLDVNYEDVVGNLEQQVRRLLEHCDLPFEESCLNFHDTKRSVKTASSEQVRKPIYSSSVNLWRHYEPYIDELIEVLEPLLLKLPSDQQPNL